MKTKARLIASLKIWIAIYPSITLFLYTFWGSTIRPALVSTNLIADVVISSLDSICGCSFCRCNHPSDFIKERKKIKQELVII